MKLGDVIKKYTKLSYIGVGLTFLFALTPVISYLFLIGRLLFYGEYDMLGMLFFLHTPIVLINTGIFGPIGLAVFFGVYFSYTRNKNEQLIIQLITGFITIGLIFLLKERLNYFLELSLTMIKSSSLKWIEVIEKIFITGPTLIILGALYDFFFKRESGRD